MLLIIVVIVIFWLIVVSEPKEPDQKTLREGFDGAETLNAIRAIVCPNGCPAPTQNLPSDNPRLVYLDVGSQQLRFLHGDGKVLDEHGKSIGNFQEKGDRLHMTIEGDSWTSSMLESVLSPITMTREKDAFKVEWFPVAQNQESQTSLTVLRANNGTMSCERYCELDWESSLRNDPRFKDGATCQYAIAKINGKMNPIFPKELPPAGSTSQLLSVCTNQINRSHNLRQRYVVTKIISQGPISQRLNAASNVRFSRMKDAHLIWTNNKESVHHGFFVDYLHTGLPLPELFANNKDDSDSKTGLAVFINTYNIQTLKLYMENTSVFERDNLKETDEIEYKDFDSLHGVYLRPGTNFIGIDCVIDPSVAKSGNGKIGFEFALMARRSGTWTPVVVSDHSWLHLQFD